jgi:hypothetical protein
MNLLTPSSSFPVCKLVSLIQLPAPGPPSLAARIIRRKLLLTNSRRRSLLLAWLISPLSNSQTQEQAQLGGWIGQGGSVHLKWTAIRSPT